MSVFFLSEILLLKYLYHIRYCVEFDNYIIQQVYLENLVSRQVGDIRIGLREIQWKRSWIGVKCLRIGISSGLLRTRKEIFGYHKMRKFF